MVASSLKKMDDDKIKVIIPFRGDEQIAVGEESNWKFDQDGHEVELMSENYRYGSGDDDGRSRFTFDHVLQNACSQEKIYEYAAK